MAQLIDIRKVEVGPKYLTARVRVATSAPLMTSEDLEGTTRVYRLMPHIIEHVCLGDAGETFKDVMGDTEIAHLLEHVTVEILAQSDIAGDIPCGRTFAVEDERRTYEIEFPCSDDVLVIGALSSAVWILQWAYSGGGDPAPDIDATVDGLVGLVQSLPVPPAPLPSVREYVVEGDEARAILAEIAAERGEVDVPEPVSEPVREEDPVEAVPAWMRRSFEEETPEEAEPAVAEELPEEAPVYEEQAFAAAYEAYEEPAYVEPELEAEPQVEEIESEPEPVIEPEPEQAAELEEEPAPAPEPEPVVEAAPEDEEPWAEPAQEEAEPEQAEEEPEEEDVEVLEEGLEPEDEAQPYDDDEPFEDELEEEPVDELGSTLVTKPLVVEPQAEEVDDLDDTGEIRLEPEEPEEHIPAPWTVR